jgi:hypothetical protein
MGLEDVKRRAERIRDWLAASGNHADAGHMDACIAVLDQPDHRAPALSGLSRMCEAEWLGSAYQSATDRTVWLREVDGLRRSCDAALRREAGSGEPPRGDVLAGGLSGGAAAAVARIGPDEFEGKSIKFLSGLLGYLLALVLIGSLIMAAGQLPTAFAPALVEVEGAVGAVRVETTLLGGFRGKPFASSRVHVGLDGEPVLYEIDVGVWDSAEDLAETLRDAGYLALRVDEARLRGVRDRIEAIRLSGEESPGAAGRLAVRAILEAWYAPVPVYEIRADGETLVTRLEMTRRDVVNFLLWAGLALLSLVTFVVLARRERRRSSFGKSPSRMA